MGQVDETEPTKTLTDQDMFSNQLDMSLEGSSDPMKSRILKQVNDLETNVNWQLYDSQEGASVYMNDPDVQNIEENATMKTEILFDIGRVYRYADLIQKQVDIM